MENQELNPIEEYKQIHEAIKGGDTDIARRYGQGEFKDLRDRADAYVIPEDESELITLEPQEPVETETEEPFDQLAHDRAIYDAEQKEWNDRVAAIQTEAEANNAQAEEFKKQNEKLMRELDEVRKANDAAEEEDDFFSTISEEPLPEKPVQSYTEPVVDNRASESDLEATVNKLVAERESEKRQQQDKEAWDSTVSSYSDFWNSDIGKELAPSGQIESNLEKFNGFAHDLSVGSDNNEAIRLMYDIRNNGMNEYYKEKLDKAGVQLPENFNSMYDSLEVKLYSQGKVIDPQRGEFVESGRGRQSSMEDAYYLMNRKKIEVQQKMDAHNEYRQKLQQRNNSAIQVSSEKYATVATTQQNFLSSNYRQNLIAQARQMGWDGSPSTVKAISDPAVRDSMQSLFASIKK